MVLSALVLSAPAAVGLAPSSALAVSADTGLIVTDVQTTPTTVAVGDQLTSVITFVIPDGTPAGVTTQLTLPAALVHLPAGFDVLDPAGNLVATATISPDSPSVITFTTTDYAQTHTDVHGTAFVTDDFDAAVAPPGQTTPFVYTFDGAQFTNPVTVEPGGAINRSAPYKFGQFAKADEGHTDPTDAIYWFIESPAAPKAGFTSTEFTDTVPDGQLIDCNSITVSVGDGNGPQNGFENGVGYGNYSFPTPCTPSSLNVLTGTVPAGKIIRVQFTVTLATASGNGVHSFANTATVIADGASRSASGSLVQSDAGGRGTGTPVPAAITITKGDSHGNAADDLAHAAALGVQPGAASLVFLVTNTGGEGLRDVTVADTVQRNGVVSGLTCTYPDGTTGTEYAGTLAAGAEFRCTAALSGVAAGAAHEDTGSVSGTGVISGTLVQDANQYWAVAKTAVVVSPTPTTPTTPTTTNPATTSPTHTSSSSTPTTTTTPVLPTSRATQTTSSTSPTRQTSTSTTASRAQTTPSSTKVAAAGATSSAAGTLAYTGASDGTLPEFVTAVLLLVAGAGVLLLARLRRGTSKH